MGDWSVGGENSAGVIAARHPTGFYRAGPIDEQAKAFTGLAPWFTVPHAW